MTMNEIGSSVQRYMEDESQLLQDWYQEYYTIELFPGEPLAVSPSMEKMQSTFAEWYTRNKAQLFNLICVEWDYIGKRKKTRFDNRIQLAAALADFLISCSLQVPAPIATAVLLVREGLDILCKVE